MSVKRYWFSAAGGHLNESAGGDLVAYSDYAALKEDNERLMRVYADACVRAGDEITALKARVVELEGNYNDLLVCVQNKIPGVTRHDRAKQCILNWEAGFSSPQHREGCTQGASQ